jgi:hypothetical protein
MGPNRMGFAKRGFRLRKRTFEPIVVTFGSVPALEFPSFDWLVSLSCDKIEERPWVDVSVRGRQATARQSPMPICNAARFRPFKHLHIG